jgi:hypothetical protein
VFAFVGLPFMPHPPGDPTEEMQGRETPPDADFGRGLFYDPRPLAFQATQVASPTPFLPRRFGLLIHFLVLMEPFR